jgi:hypothetical protein
MRSTLYETTAFGLLASSLFAYYRCASFLASQNYVAALIAILIGFSLVRAGTDMSRLAAVIRRDG